MSNDILNLNAFDFYDFWLLYSIGFGKKGARIKDIVSLGDYLNRAIFSLDELNYGMSKLVYNGYVAKDKDKFYVTNKARDFYARAKNCKEGCIQEMFELAQIFAQEPIQSGCKLTVYFAQYAAGKYYTL